MMLEVPFQQALFEPDSVGFGSHLAHPISYSSESPTSAIILMFVELCLAWREISPEPSLQAILVTRRADVNDVRLSTDAPDSGRLADNVNGKRRSSWELFSIDPIATGG
jgi:hypothetical protein